MLLLCFNKYVYIFKLEQAYEARAFKIYVIE